MNNKLAVIGVGNMAKAIIQGVLSSDLSLDQIILFDRNPQQYEGLRSDRIAFHIAESIEDAAKHADCVLLSVKPQNYDAVLSEIACVPNHREKLYISIGAGITSQSVSERLGNACVIRVLPNVPMLIGEGVSLICKNSMASNDEMTFVSEIFQSAGSVLMIEESEMNRMIGVTSSSPAYIFSFIQAIYEGAMAQGLDNESLLKTICDVVIGSALMLKQSKESPKDLISRVASKGGTTEQALNKLQEYRFEEAIREAMKACTKRADELANS